MGYSDPTFALLASRELRASRGLNHFLARTPSQKEAVFRLRYEAYLSGGLISENRTGQLSDGFDRDESSVIYGITLNDQLVSTIRLTILSDERRSSGSYKSFSDYLDPILDRGEKIVDGTRLAVSCRSGADRRNVLLYTLSLTALFASSSDIDHGAISVHESHVPFYRRFGFDVVGEARPYCGVQVSTRLMMTRLYRSIECRPELLPSPKRNPSAEASGFKRETSWA